MLQRHMLPQTKEQNLVFVSIEDYETIELIREFLEPLGVVLKTVADFPEATEVDETGSTFAPHYIRTRTNVTPYCDVGHLYSLPNQGILALRVPPQQSSVD